MRNRDSVLIALSNPLVSDALYQGLRGIGTIYPPERTMWGMEAALDRLNPAVAIIGTELDGAGMLERLGQLVSFHPKTRFVICECQLPPAVAEFVKLQGAVAATGYDVRLEVLRKSVSTLLEGHPRPNSPHTTGTAAVGQGMRLPLHSLTSRERQLLFHLQAGRSHRDAARRMGISPKTEEYHSRSLRKKFGIPAHQPINYSMCVGSPLSEGITEGSEG